MAKSPSPPKPPPEPKPWAELPIEARGDPEPNALYNAVGRALSAWEALDEVQATLFAVLVNSRNMAGEAAYGMVQSVEAQSRMVVAAAERIYNVYNPIRIEIVELIDKVGSLAGRRNDIAHGYVTQMGSQEFDGPDMDWGCFLIPGHANTKKRVSDDEREKRHLEHGLGRYGTGGPNPPPQFQFRYAYTAAQVLTYAGHFNAYQRKILDLSVKVHKDLQQRMPPPSILALQYEQRIRALQTRLNNLERAQPPRSSDLESEEGKS